MHRATTIEPEAPRTVAASENGLEPGIAVGRIGLEPSHETNRLSALRVERTEVLAATRDIHTRIQAIEGGGIARRAETGNGRAGNTWYHSRLIKGIAGRAAHAAIVGGDGQSARIRLNGIVGFIHAQINRRVGAQDVIRVLGMVGCRRVTEVLQHGAG